MTYGEWTRYYCVFVSGGHVVGHIIIVSADTLLGEWVADRGRFGFGTKKWGTEKWMRLGFRENPFFDMPPDLERV
jgi:hypothetical protein